MSKIVNFENKKFAVIPDEDEKYIIYVLQEFKSGNYKEFFFRQTGVYFFLYVSTVKMPNGLWAYGFESNILELSNQKVYGTAVDGFKTELQALQNCLIKFVKYGLCNRKYGFTILSKFDKFVNPKTLFD
ncbi:hypothetical protein TDCHD05_180010 [Tenacibaculum dicentrarchi]|nr:hypothetical protein TDCHD05_180010 [Tenacibaculum dicentrarchi]